MRNAIHSSPFSQLNSMGQSDIQLLNMEVPLETANYFGFCMESKLYNNDSKLKDVGFTIPCQHPISYQPEVCHANVYRTDNISPESMLPISLQQTESNVKKREFLAQNGPRTAAGDNSALNNWKNKKRMKPNDSEPGLNSSVQEQSAAIQFPILHVPGRRSQRLGDKITALQKLVSPYGKTDTASVLQEACLSIKLLQDHIQNLLRMQSSSYKSLSSQQGIGQKQREDLRSKGLCLASMTFTQKVAINQDMADSSSSQLSRNIIVLPHNL